MSGWWNEVAANRVVANSLHVVVRIRGNFSIERIIFLFRSAFHRHDLLRARTVMRGDSPFLIFDGVWEPSSMMREPFLHAPQGWSEVNTFIEKVVWDSSPGDALFRAFLFRLAPRECVVGFVLNHFVGDVHSCQILAGEILAKIRRPGEKVASVPPPLQYSEYLRARAEWLQGAGAQHRFAYWKEHMEGSRAVQLPGAREVVVGRVGTMESVSFEIPAELRERLARVAAECRATISAVLLAAKFAALFEMTQRTDLVVILVISGRDQAATTDMVGNTVDHLPLRLAVVGGMTLMELVNRVQDACIVGCKYRIPWGLLLDAMRAVGASDVSPLFNLISVGDLAPSEEHPVAENDLIVIEDVAVKKPPEQGGVTWHSSHEMHLCDSGSRIQGLVKFMTTRYAREVVEKFVARFAFHVERLAKQPRSMVGVAGARAGPAAC